MVSKRNVNIKKNKTNKKLVKVKNEGTPTNKKDLSIDFKNLTKDARRDKLKEYIGLVKNSTLAEMFGVTHKTILQDIHELGEEEISQSVKQTLIVQDESLITAIKRRIRPLLDSNNHNSVIGAARTLLSIQEHRIKARQDLGILKLPTQKIEQLNVNAVTYDDFQEAYEELGIETIGKKQKDKGSSAKTVQSFSDTDAVQNS